jgi:hypothetical protein
MNSIASQSPIVEGIVASILNTYHVEPPKKAKYVLNADLVPRLHDSPVMQRENLQESIMRPQMMKTRPEPIQIPARATQQVQAKQFTPQTTEKITIYEKPTPAPANLTYRKIFPLLKDPFITHIECSGPNTPLTIVKAGNNQRTNISLSKEEINEFLNYLSERSRIPLMEGVFRAIVDNMLVNAVVSDVLDPKFIIKKNFAHELNFGQ